MKNAGFQFTADFPDDMIDEGEGEDWQVVRPGGMALSYAIADLLRGAGMSVSEPEVELEHECWVFDVEREGRRYATRVYDFDEPKSLHVTGSSPWLKRWLSRRDFYREYVEALSELLSNDPRFSAVQLVDVNHRPISFD